MTTEQDDTTTDDTDAEISTDETSGDSDLGEHSSRLSTERDDPPADDDADTDDDADADDDADPGAGDSFPRPYVERLRARSAGYRTRATAAEARVGDLERALFTERVRALDVLADPSDMAFDADMLDDADALAGAVADLVAARPHYRKRGTTSTGTTGSREAASPRDGVSLTGIMRGHG